MSLGGTSLVEDKKMWKRARVLSQLLLMCQVLTRVVLLRVSLTWQLPGAGAQLLILNRPIKDTINKESQKKDTYSVGTPWEEEQRSSDSCVHF